MAAIRNIALDGDIIFILGEEKNCRRLRVHSVVLKHASDVFRALLGPHFSEGQNLSSESPREIPFPDDDPDAMEVICNIAHHNLESVELLGPTEVLDVAVLADKYDCIALIKYPWIQWLAHAFELGPGIGGAAELMAAAYLIGDKHGFAQTTQLLLFDHNGSYLELMSNKISPIMPQTIPYFLAERRARLHTKLAEILVSRAHSRLTCRCGHSERLISHYMTQLWRNSLGPFAGSALPVKSLIESTERLEEPALPFGIEDRYQSCDGTRHGKMGFNTYIRPLVENLKKQPGLCLTCILMKEKDPKGHCEEDHGIM